jgi:hypothetical protein
MALHYVLEYEASPTTCSPAQLGAAMAAVPIQGDLPDVLGLSLVSDTTTPGQPTTRVVEYMSGAGPVPDDQIAPMLIDFMKSTLAQALSTTIVSLPVVVF